MIIEKIKIKNYRQYKGEINFELGASKNKNINIVVGSNGTGKTNLSNAIQWCFYGIEPSLKQIGIEFGILNMEVFRQMEEDTTCEIRVDVTFRLRNGEVYSVERVKNITKKQNRQEILPFENCEKDGSSFRAYFHGRGSHLLDENFPSRLINALAPEKIREFFFFDGEKLENYFKDSSREKIKNSIFKISQLDLLMLMEKRLEILVREYRQEAKRISPHSGEICKRIDVLEKNKEDKTEKLEEKEESFYKLRETRTELMDKYRKYGGDVRRLIERNEILERLLDGIKKELVRKKDEKREIILKNASLFVGDKALRDAISLFADARKKKIIPPNINPDFIEEILKKGVCICKTDISKNDSKARSNVQNLLEKLSKLGSQASELIEKERDMLNIHSARLPSVLDNIRVLNDSIVSLEEQINNITKELEENSSKIGSDDIDKNQITNFEVRQTELNNLIERTKGEIEVLKAKREEIEYSLKMEKDKLEKENQRQAKGENLNRIINFCERAKEYVSNIQAKIMNGIRQEISKETEEHYKELHWKKNENIDIVIDENYTIAALQNDYNKFGVFAAGESALLAMSFLIALNNVSGFSVPIVMDTALGRISTGPRENFARNIARYLKNNQLIMLFTQAEFSPEVRSNLLKYIHHSYSLEMPSSSLAVKLRQET